MCLHSIRTIFIFSSSLCLLMIVLVLVLGFLPPTNVQSMPIINRQFWVRDRTFSVSVSILVSVESFGSVWVFCLHFLSIFVPVLVYTNRNSDTLCFDFKLRLRLITTRLAGRKEWVDTQTLVGRQQLFFMGGPRTNFLGLRGGGGIH